MKMERSLAKSRLKRTRQPNDRSIAMKNKKEFKGAVKNKKKLIEKDGSAECVEALKSKKAEKHCIKPEKHPCEKEYVEDNEKDKVSCSSNGDKRKLTGHDTSKPRRSKRIKSSDESAETHFAASGEISSRASSVLSDISETNSCEILNINGTRSHTGPNGRKRSSSEKNGKSKQINKRTLNTLELKSEETKSLSIDQCELKKCKAKQATVFSSSVENSSNFIDVNEFDASGTKQRKIKSDLEIPKRNIKQDSKSKKSVKCKVSLDEALDYSESSTYKMTKRTSDAHKPNPRRSKRVKISDESDETNSQMSADSVLSISTDFSEEMSENASCQINKKVSQTDNKQVAQNNKKMSVKQTSNIQPDSIDSNKHGHLDQPLEKRKKPTKKSLQGQKADMLLEDGKKARKQTSEGRKLMSTEKCDIKKRRAKQTIISDTDDDSSDFVVVIEPENTRNSVKRQTTMKSESKIHPKTTKQNKKLKTSVKSQVNAYKVSKFIKNISEIPTPSTSGFVPPVRPRVDSSDVTAVLLSMEGATIQQTDGSLQKSSSENSAGSSGSWEDIDSSDDEDGDWEEVEVDKSATSSQIPEKAVEITLDAPVLYKKREKKTTAYDWRHYYKMLRNRFKRQLRMNVHKVHLLCLLAGGLYMNQVCNDETLHAQCLSLMPNEYATLSPRAFNLNTLGRILHWYKNIITLDIPINSSPKESLVDVNCLQHCLESKKTEREEKFVMIFIIILRLLGLDVRLILSLHPAPFNPPKNVENMKKKPESGKSVKDSNKDESNDSSLHIVENKNKKSKSEKSTQSKSSKKSHPDNQEKEAKKQCAETTVEKSKKASKGTKSTNKRKSVHESKYFSDENVPKRKTQEVEKRKSGRKRKIDVSYKEKLSGDEIDDDGDDADDGDFKDKDDSESTEFETEIKYRSPKAGRTERKSHCKKKEDLHCDEGLKTKGATRSDVWLEVYLISEKRWICVDCKRSVIDKASHFEKFASKPLKYVLGFKNDNSIKDLTPRYASDWLFSTRKFRVDPDWWTDTLSAYKSKMADLDEVENENMKEQLFAQPIPTSMSKLKNHPLYILQRHLLKYEAIYPDTAAPLGFLKTEPIYARECVHTIHSRENWLKEGLSVKVGETAYKMVKSNANSKRARNIHASERPKLELFGKWQTETYVSPPVENGIVPRNAYGNVDLYKPTMLPAGAVHLKGLPGLNKIARKLKIDVASAMVGWDVHHGWSHPLFDGWVAPEEHKDILLAAWDEDQELQQEREAEKREKRIWTNWKTLIKGAMIKEKLKTKYNTQDELPEVKPEVKKAPQSKKKKKKTESESVSTECSWPTNRLKEKNLKSDTIFHVEEL